MDRGPRPQVGECPLSLRPPPAKVIFRTLSAFRERFFERRQIHEAIAYAREGGIAVHRNLDLYDGRLSARGMVMTRPFLHVIGLRPRLEEWSRREGIPVQAIQPEKHRGVAHIDVFGEYARRLMERLERRGPEADCAENADS